jgi:hypothetical protein
LWTISVFQNIWPIWTKYRDFGAQVAILVQGCLVLGAKEDRIARMVPEGMTKALWHGTVRDDEKL